MLNVKTTAPAASRGLWCNLCGSRLAGKSLPLRFARWVRRSEDATLPDVETAWSICVQCYEGRLRCATCGVAVGTQAFMLEGDARFYCRHCFENRPRCDTCDRPVGAHYWTRRDGRKLCDRCQSTAVADPNVAYALYGRVRTALARQLGMALREPCQLRLVNRRQLLGMVDRSSLHSLDADSRGRCFGLFLHHGAHKAIFIEYGLPQIVLLEVMAHEYAHAWQSENCPLGMDPELQEGFAEWVAYKLLDGWGCSRRSDRMLRRDDLYGRGLKLVLAWEARGGKAEVFRRICAGRHARTLQ
jgi:hypothetical protein